MIPSFYNIDHNVYIGKKSYLYIIGICNIIKSCLDFDFLVLLAVLHLTDDRLYVGTLEIVCIIYRLPI